MTRQANIPTAMSPGITPRGATPTVPATAMITFKDLVGIARRRMWLIIICTILGTIVGVVGWYVKLRYWPEYTAVGLVRCKMPSSWLSSVFQDRPDL